MARWLTNDPLARAFEGNCRIAVSLQWAAMACCPCTHRVQVKPQLSLEAFWDPAACVRTHTETCMSEKCRSPARSGVVAIGMFFTYCRSSIESRSEDYGGYLERSAEGTGRPSGPR